MLLKIKNLKKYFPVRRGFLKRLIGQVRAVDNVSLEIESSKTLGLVGESGCGKTTLAKLIMKLMIPTEGEIMLDEKSVNRLQSGLELMNYRRSVQMVFQDPFHSLHPRMRIKEMLKEPFQIHHRYSKSEWDNKVSELLEAVGLNPEMASRYPHEFSGGERQRLAIARALALRPKLMILDEPVSSLDVSIRSQILDLFLKLQKEQNIAYLFISHDLKVIRHMSDYILVMYLGKVCEKGGRDQVIEKPLHPYTQSLFISSLSREARLKKQFVRGIDLPSPLNHPSGCVFRTRCPYAEKICEKKEPELLEKRPGQWAACHLV